MRIVFICGSLNPGRDGVGDYTRALAAELRDLGHECRLLSIMDSENSSEESGGISIERRINCLRSPDARKDAWQLVRAWEPDWISLQFVPYAYHNRGLIYALLPWVSKIRQVGKLHILFHELWNETKPGHGIKSQLVSSAQRLLTVWGTRSWKPDRVHTTIKKYQNTLASIGVGADLLPLFGNIKIAPAEGEYAKGSTSDPNELTNQRIVIFPFSQSAEWKGREFAAKLCELARAAGLELKFVQIGRCRAFETHWPAISEIVGHYGWPCELLGETDAATLSRQMLRADIGVSPANLDLAMKSGGVLTMLEHGLSVICSGSSESMPNVEHVSDEPLLQWREENDPIKDLLIAPRKFKPSRRLPRIAKEFIEGLQ